MPNLILYEPLPEGVIHLLNLNVDRFAQVSDEAFSDAILISVLFDSWDKELQSVEVKLDKDPTINIHGFFAKLEEIQAHKDRTIAILTQALGIKARWEAYLVTADKFLKQAKSQLSSLEEVSGKKNKELQEAMMYSKFPPVFDFYTFCDSTLSWIKTMILIFDKRLDLIDSANLNLNRQINVTELLSTRGLI